MNQYTFVWTFNAENIEEAEDVAASLVRPKIVGRTALFYNDPISGDLKLWAEPTMTAAELEVRRNRE